ncbi:MAG: hypothetical protein SPG09_07900 [Lachnospiraceae bacterium]|nr:hypothetical protein [bacterium]MDY5517515.1 hypothetical protein [Lachnospiraceae bacterium]
MTVYDALEKRHVMPRAWDDWADYRRAWSDWIIAHCKWDTSILIVGAGACNDYDLEHFTKFFGKVLLLDMDEASMQEAKKRVPVAHRDKIQLFTGDFLGITPQAYQEFCRKIQEEINHRGKLTDITELAQMALLLVEKLYADAKKNREKLTLPQADYVAVSGVHSQVNHMLPWIWQAYMQALGQREEMIFQRISQENARIMHEMNDKLLVAAGQKLFVAAEKARVGVPGGVEGAWQALEDLKKRAEVPIADSKKFAWGYDLRQNMIYEMEGLVADTRNRYEENKIGGTFYAQNTRSTN